MKRLNILIPGSVVCELIVVCGLVAWYSSQPSLARQKPNDQAAKWEHLSFRSATGKDVDVLVLRLWDSAASDPRWPQLALLRLQPDVYRELRDPKALKAFIDGTQTGKPIFDAPVTITEDCKLPKAGDEKPGGGVSWLVIVGHRTSRCSCRAFQEHAITQ